MFNPPGNIRTFLVAAFVCVSASKFQEERCQCVTSCFCSVANHFCTPPRFPDFLGFFKSTLKNFPNLANLTSDLSSKLIKRDCLTFAPLLRTDWEDFDRLVCSSLQSALEADVLLKMAVDETCTEDKNANFEPPEQVGYDSHAPMNLEHATLDFSLDNKKRRGGRENEDYDDDDNDDVGEDGTNQFEEKLAPRLYGYHPVGMNFKINNRSDHHHQLENKQWESSSHDYDPSLDRGDDDDDDDGYRTMYGEQGAGYGLEDSGRSLMRSQDGEDQSEGQLLSKQDISLVVILTSILLSIILLTVIFYRIRKRHTSLPKEDIPTKLASHPWYNGTTSQQEKETSFIEDRLTRNYKTHPVKRYL